MLCSQKLMKILKNVKKCRSSESLQHLGVKCEYYFSMLGFICIERFLSFLNSFDIQFKAEENYQHYEKDVGIKGISTKGAMVPKDRTSISRYCREAKN